MNAVNLLPAKQGRGGFGSPAGNRVPLIALGAAVLVAGVGYWAWTARSEATRLADQVSAVQAEKQGLESRLQAMLAVDQRASVQLARRGAVVQLTASRINWERLTRDTVTIVPKGVWLSEVSGQSPQAGTALPAPAPAGGQPAAVNTVPQGLHLEGFAFTQPDVARLMSRLDAVPGLGEPRLASAERITRGGRKVVQFIIDAPIDQRAQDRPTLDVASGSGAAPGAAGATASGGAGTGTGGFVP